MEPTPQGELPKDSENFMHGRLVQLLKTCGFQRLPKELMVAADKLKSRHGLDVHLPEYSEVPTEV